MTGVSTAEQSADIHIIEGNTIKYNTNNKKNRQQINIYGHLCMVIKI